MNKKPFRNCDNRNRILTIKPEKLAFGSLPVLWVLLSPIKLSGYSTDKGLL
jgi:hypothetical protein